MRSFPFFRILLVALGLSLMGVLNSCKDDNPADPGDPPNSQEQITTVTLILDHNSPSFQPLHEIRATWRDIDGPGGNPPTIDTLKLHAGTTYSGTILLLDETKTPPDTISNEVEEEADVHLFVYTTGGSVDTLMSVSIDDLDPFNQPIGLSYVVVVDSTATGGTTGTLTVELRHFAERAHKAAGAPFETDIEVTFPVLIEH